MATNPNESFEIEHIRAGNEKRKEIANLNQDFVIWFGMILAQSTGVLSRSQFLFRSTDLEHIHIYLIYKLE